MLSSQQPPVNPLLKKMGRRLSAPLPGGSLLRRNELRLARLFSLPPRSSPPWLQLEHRALPLKPTAAA
jgi:hypothetical protein